MRIPGTQPVANRIVRAFQLTASDIRVVKRGYRAVWAAIRGAAATTFTVGVPFHDVKTAATQIISTALFMGADKRKSEQTSEALYTDPPTEEK